MKNNGIAMTLLTLPLLLWATGCKDSGKEWHWMGAGPIVVDEAKKHYCKYGEFPRDLDEFVRSLETRGGRDTPRRGDKFAWTIIKVTEGVKLDPKTTILMGDKETIIADILIEVKPRNEAETKQMTFVTEFPASAAKYLGKRFCCKDLADNKLP